jgi:hypothetical protein
MAKPIRLTRFIHRQSRSFLRMIGPLIWQLLLELFSDGKSHSVD